ncbi:MFS transporter [Haloechinothrix sp. LS1_15]|uniref:MFS transporter n=1 Tax=Haloechinothrix sp. LS1_15 TaxID=2652248 RepID=UPI002944A438|nr:MFS transporter [Haloechinothrix sp. LS1_15]MDV6011640.1 MFS transporter [Haloechinothrix sp. LS1_15]
MAENEVRGASGTAGPAGDGDAAPLKAGRREWIGLAVLALPTLLLALDISVLFLALPQLGADLQPSGTQQLWIMDIYGFMIAGFLVTMGTLGDRVGRRKLLMIGAFAFGLASVFAAFSTSAEMLIVARALLGIAGATLMPSTLSLISNMFRDPRQRAVGIGVWMTCFSVGTAIGPVVGGIMLEFFWWGSVFLLGVPVMVILLVLAPVLLPEYRNPNAGRLDFTSVGLSLAAALPVVYGLKQLAKYGLDATPLLAVLIGFAFGVAFVRRQRRLTDPLLDLQLFSNRAFSGALCVLMLGAMTLGGANLLVPQYLQSVLGMSPLQAAFWIVPSALGIVTGSMLAPAIARRVRPGFVVGAGLLISASGYLMFTQVAATGGLAVLVTGFTVAFFGLSPMLVLSTDLIVGSAPKEKAGSASAMSETSGEFGVALGVATMGSVATAVYRTEVTGSVPDAVPGEVSRAVSDTLPGAISAVEALPAQLAAEVLEPARESFTQGLNAVGLVSALLAAGLAVTAAVLLRHVRPSAERAAEQAAAETEPVASGAGQR